MPAPRVISMNERQRIQKILDLLDEHYSVQKKCWLDYDNAWQLLFATILSAQCTDARVNIVTKDLFKKYKTVEDFANADYDELCEDIRSTGFYRNKAKNIIACCNKLIENFEGRVPDNMEDLLTLDGVGRKTANLVCGDIYKKPAVVTDTHCIRISGRLGLVPALEKNPVKVERILSAIIEKEKQSDFCHRLVMFGRDICSAKNPLCDECPLADLCKNKKA